MRNTLCRLSTAIPPAFRLGAILLCVGATGCGPDFLDQDTDSDGIVNSSDQCPTVDEVVNDFNDDDGCPDAAPKAPLSPEWSLSDWRAQSSTIVMEGHPATQWQGIHMGVTPLASDGIVSGISFGAADVFVVGEGNEWAWSGQQWLRIGGPATDGCYDVLLVLTSAHAALSAGVVAYEADGASDVCGRALGFHLSATLHPVDPRG